MDNTKNWKESLASLRKSNDAKSRLSSLNSCAALQITNPAMLKSYHDLLIFILAYAIDEKSNRFAEDELARLACLLKNHSSNQNWQHKLSNSGLPYTEMCSQYSASIVKWLIDAFPDHLLPFEAESNSEVFQQLSQAALPGIEFHHTTQGKYNIWNRIKLLSGHFRNTAALKWLINLIDQQDWTPVLKTKVYDELKIFVRWKLSNEKTGITYTKWPVKDVFFQKTHKSKIDALSILKKKVNDPLSLSLDEKWNLISLIRSCLALYARETDPVTYADPGETFMYEMGDGLQIALTGMVKDRRLALESYIGYMAFKNGIPVSYGGGWIWGHRCKIGINIFPPFRGGGSDKLFCQIMRLFFQVYHIRCFVVKPYQFGKGNPEGLKTGAFWFYYKLGFRPVNEDIRKMADSEWEKIRLGNQYRTSVSLLKKFTACNKEWEPEKTSFFFSNADKISIAITKMINERFAGDRKVAIEISTKEMKKFLAIKRMPVLLPIEKKVWSNWCLLFTCLPGTSNWTRSDRMKFHQIMQNKSTGDEIDYIYLLQKHKKIWISIKTLLAI